MRANVTNRDFPRRKAVTARSTLAKAPLGHAMTRQPIPQLVRHALARHALADVADAQLLARFVANRDAEAFTELVERHAGLVWAPVAAYLPTCTSPRTRFRRRSLLLHARLVHFADPSDCRDGFTASLAESPGNIGRPCLAINLRLHSMLLPRRPSPLEQMSGKELVAAIEAEVDRLPDEYRSAVLLCWFQDCSLDDAARQLGTTRGKLWGWLKRRSRTPAEAPGEPRVRSARGLGCRADHQRTGLGADYPSGRRVGTSRAGCTGARDRRDRQSASHCQAARPGRPGRVRRGRTRDPATGRHAGDATG